jgi:hypothetical protein
MKKQSLLALSVFALAFLSLTGCEKESDPPPPKTNTELIIQSSWKFDKAASGGVDVSGLVPACWKDNVAVFVSNGTATVDESTNVCSPSIAGSFMWEFQSNETILHLSAPLFPGGSNDFTIVSLDETNLVVSQNITIPPAGAQNVVFTFKH